MASIVTLARWLGPWASATKAPIVETVDEIVDGTRVRLYRPRRAPDATYLIAPGLHYAGADDPRMDRFCRILAAAGHLVIAPFIPDYLALTPNARAIADFRRVFDALPAWTEYPPSGIPRHHPPSGIPRHHPPSGIPRHHKPVVFSISFGSLLAFALAADVQDAIDKLVIFGGYADFRQTLRFCLTGEVASGRSAMRDPLNQPVVLANLLAH